MAKIPDLQQNQAIIRAELDQLISSLWPVFRERGELWVDRLDQMIQTFMRHDRDPWRVVGTLAQIGFLTMLERWEEPPHGDK